MKSTTNEIAARVLRDLVLNAALIEVGRKAIENALLEFRKRRISQPFRGNGLGIKEKDGKDIMVAIRLGPEEGLRIGLKEIADYLEQNK